MKAGVRVVQDSLQQVMAVIAAIQKDAVYVGIPDDTDGRDGPIGNAAIGYIQEHGSDAAGIPPRPFLKPGVAKVADQCAKELGMGIARALTNTNAAEITKGQNRAGLIAQNSVRAQFTDNDWQELSSATIKAREDRGVTRTNPLIDTGQLRKSVTYVVRSSRGAD